MFFWCFFVLVVWSVLGNSRKDTFITPAMDFWHWHHSKHLIKNESIHYVYIEPSQLPVQPRWTKHDCHCMLHVANHCQASHKHWWLHCKSWCSLLISAAMTAVAAPKPTPGGGCVPLPNGESHTLKMDIVCMYRYGMLKYQRWVPSSSSLIMSDIRVSLVSASSVPWVPCLSWEPRCPTSGFFTNTHRWAECLKR